jgi:uncharacterized protein YndB with AHSA1/START domain
MRLWFLVTALLLSASAAAAEVVDSGEHGFTVRSAARISAHPSRVYNAAANLIGRWWDPAHTFSQSAANLSLDPRPGGCLCERLTTGGVMHLTVVYVSVNQEVRFAGALGPLQQMGVAGSMVWKIAEADGHTQFDWTYTVGGYRAGGLGTIAAAVDGVLAGQLQRLKRFIETGSVN